MAVTLDAVSTDMGTNLTNVSISHTVASDANFLILYTGGAWTYDDARQETDPAWNGDTLTELGKYENPDNSRTDSRIAYLVNPDTGTYNLTVEWDGVVDAEFILASFKGVNPNDPIGTVSTWLAEANGYVNAVCDFGDAANQYPLAYVCRYVSAGTYSVGSGETIIGSVYGNGGNYPTCIAVATKDSPTGSDTITFTHSTSTDRKWIGVGFGLNPKPASGGAIIFTKKMNDLWDKWHKKNPWNIKNGIWQKNPGLI